MTNSATRELSGARARTWPQVLDELLLRLVSPSAQATVVAPHVRAPASVAGLLFLFVVASAPALGVGLWNLGLQTFDALAAVDLDATLGWRSRVVDGLGLPASGDSLLACITVGLLYFIPVLVVALAASIFWEVLFATVRERDVDPGWLMSGWLYALLLPASLPLWLVLLGMSFGAVLGRHIFGGTGMYLVSPPLLGFLFLYFGYPAFFAGDAALGTILGVSAVSGWSLVAEGGIASGITWPALFLGRELGGLATGSALACLAGAAYLVFRGAASGRTLLGALGGLVAATLIFNYRGGEDPVWLLPWHWHLAAGGFAFGVAFLATDPSISPTTRTGRWIFGVLIGVLTVVMRVVNPTHPDGALLAILVSSLAVPLIDFCVLRAWLARSRRRLDG